MMVLPTLFRCRAPAFCVVFPPKRGHFPSSYIVMFSKDAENESIGIKHGELFLASELSMNGTRCQSGTVLDH